MDKKQLLQKIQNLDSLSQEEKTHLANLLNTSKKYGLVWEDKPEEVEELLRSQLPILQEVKEKRIIGKDIPPIEKPIKKEEGTQMPLLAEDKAAYKKESTKPNEKKQNPNHLLIEGDNLHALTALSFTHKEKIDVIYIDPPYNTGNKDFKYNDRFVDKEDSYRHSKWLSFMQKRLKIAYSLLKDTGVIFISIDDNEQAPLKLLCDEIFGEENFISNIIWQRAFSPINLKKTISQNHDFILAYCKQDFANFELNKLPRSLEATDRYKNPDNDVRGVWTSGDLSVGPAIEKNIYPITTPSGKVILPPNGRSWVLNKDRFEEFLQDNRVWFGSKGDNVPRIKRFLSDVRDGVVALSLWTHSEVGHTQDGKKELKNIFPETLNPFETVKPLKLINRILKLSSQKDSIILDFFAGSGTTLHAVMELNQEDGGNRQCILVTNNENNICEEVTYERNRKVIEGYTNAKGEAVQGLGGNNLRYYRCGYVPRNTGIAAKKELTYRATELLCIKEDCYTELTADYTEQAPDAATWIRIFAEADRQFMVIYDDLQIEESLEMIRAFQANKQNDALIKIYVFSNGQYPYEDDFEEVTQWIELCALPDAIYKAYQEILPNTESDGVASSDPIASPNQQNLLF